jgi:hypothetical protein
MAWALALLTEASRGGSATAAAEPLGQYRGRPRQPTLGWHDKHTTEHGGNHDLTRPQGRR